MDIEYLKSEILLQKKLAKIDLSECPEEEHLLWDMFDLRKFIIHPFSKVFPVIERLTINRTLPNNENERITEIKFLKNPPDEAVSKHGRANLKGQSILYATLHLPTALNENMPKEGDLITLSTWEVVNKKPLIVYPVIDVSDCKDVQLLNEFSKFLSMYPESVREVIISDYSFIASCFKRPVEKGKEINYSSSAYFANRILYKESDKKIDAIIYPSVKDSVKTENLAIKPTVFNEMYRLKEVKESYVEVINEGHLFMKRTNKTVNFKDGKILWE